MSVINESLRDVVARAAENEPEADPKALIPKAGKIIVKPDSFRYEGRLVIPQKQQSRPTTGVVIAIAPDVTAVRLGERVVYTRMSGVIIKLKNQPFLMVMTEDEIMAEIPNPSHEMEPEDPSIMAENL